ncbi:Ppx/GppA family phosphatase [Aquabacterium sp. A7-Y]|uniref:Ppx/GppA phosphatase family protein n=1 Tax=Aquabacterium sp. A7-Y TaxID=1349605 RepID=UPI00223DDD9E|nr:Ppx/GppA phosphatase family protein [Aquabacterium sp. A7-Y]MCW7539139.1 Ppx/GppA family phosphatase [Aquabacterium sp. A7-Y]
MSLEKTATAPLASTDTSNAAGLLAGIDMGSNSFRLEIGQIVRGRYKRIDYLKETVRLGGGLDADGMLTEEASLRGLVCLARFAERLQGFGPQQVRAVATQTLREAKNRDAFLARAQAVLGHPIEVISGREEARLIYAGVARLMPPSAGRRLVIDIGGRSTEMILGEGRAPLVAESFQIGSVGLSMRYFPAGRYTSEGFRAAQVAAGAELEEALEIFAPGQWSEALGSSGTVGAVSQLLLASGITDGTITPDGLRWCIEQCLRAGEVERLVLPGLKDERRPVLGGGLSILYTLAIHFGIDALRPARGALRQGVIFDLDERRSAARDSRHVHDVRDESVQQLQERFGVDLEQAGRVAQVAETLYRSIEPPGDGEALRQLRWAAALHELGMMVSHHDHHRHSAYLLAHVDAPGFSQSEQRRLANLVLGQRGGLRKLEEPLQDEGFAWQALCLRLAALLCHARRLPSLGEISLRRTGRSAELSTSRGWEQAHPRAIFLLKEEAQAWERSGVLRLVLHALD